MIDHIHLLPHKAENFLHYGHMVLHIIYIQNIIQSSCHKFGQEFSKGRFYCMTRMTNILQPQFLVVSPFSKYHDWISF